MSEEPPQSSPGDIVLTVEEVKKHDTPESCWVILEGKVYDLTEFSRTHPGGQRTILGLGGIDATFDFTDTGHGDKHRNGVAKYALGPVGSTYNPNCTPTPLLKVRSQSAGSKSQIGFFPPSDPVGNQSRTHPSRIHVSNQVKPQNDQFFMPPSPLSPKNNSSSCGDCSIQ